jgi:hypothetical protein
MVLQTKNTRHKKFSLEKYQRIYFIDDSGISGKYFSALGKMPTDFVRRQSRW